MNMKNALRLSGAAALCLLIVPFMAGCKKEPEKKAEQDQAVVLPAQPVSLTGMAINKNEGTGSTIINITASGAFRYSVVPKSDPERLIVIVHNAMPGKIPANVEVNDGTIKKVEVAALDTGKGPAARITVGLAGKVVHQALPVENALTIDIKPAK